MIKVQLSKIEALPIDGKLSKEQMESTSASLLAAVLATNAEFTCRVLREERAEFAGQVRFEVVCPANEIGEEEHDGYGIARAMYYQDIDAVCATEDLSDLEWTVDHYEIIY